MTFHAKRFGRAASTYTQYAEVQNKMADTLIELLPNALIGFLANKIPENSPRFLEMGCGTGIFSQKLIDKTSNTNWTITDAAAGMLRHTQTNLKLKGQINFQIFDALGGNKLLANNFNLAASNAMVQWFPNLTLHFKMVAAHLIPEGVYLVSGFRSDNFPELNALLSRPPFEYRNFPGHTEGEIFAAAETSGFAVEKLITESIEQTYPTSREFLNAIKGLGSARRPENSPLTRSKLEFLIQEYQMLYACDGGVKATWKPWCARLINYP